MTTEHSIPPARYATLRDYLQVLRRYAVIIAAIGAAGAIAGFIYSTQQTATYTATAEVNFQDPVQALGIVGLSTNSVQSPGQVAAVAAELVTGPKVMDQVRIQLRTQRLNGSVSAQVAIPSDLLQIQVKSSDATDAKNVANTVAQVLVAQENAQTRGQYAQLAAKVQGQIARLTASGAAAGNSPSSSRLVFFEDELAKLQTLASFAKAADFAKPAAQPGSSSSTGAAKSTLLGLLFGLLLAVALAFLRDSMDRRLRDAHDVQAWLRLPVLGHIRAQILGRVAQIPDGSRGDRTIDLEAFRIVRRNLELLDPERAPKSILVTSAVAEEGKSTVASSLALAFAAAGRRTLLVDADLRRPSLAGRLRVEEVPGLTDYLAGSASPHDALRTVEFSEPQPTNGSLPSTNGHVTPGSVHRLVFIPSGSRTTRTAELLGSNRFKEFIEQVSDTYDVVVFDSSPLLPVSDTLEMLPNIGAIVLCVREGRTTKDQAGAAKTALARFPQRPIGIVVTGVKLRGGSYEAVYAHAYAEA